MLTLWFCCLYFCDTRLRPLINHAITDPNPVIAPNVSRYRDACIQCEPTFNVRPSGGWYGFRLYVFSLVWIFPNSVSRSRFSVPHSRFCEPLYVANSALLRFISVYESLSFVLCHNFCMLWTSFVSCKMNWQVVSTSIIFHFLTASN